MAADDNGAGMDMMDAPPLIVKAQYIKDLSFECRARRRSSAG